jgi:hypothetical protein
MPDVTISHSTRLPENTSKVAGYQGERFTILMADSLATLYLTGSVNDYLLPDHELDGPIGLEE